MWDLWWTKWQWHRFLPEYIGFSLSISFQRCSITWKKKKQKKLLIFITGLHDTPQGCGASVASAAGTFTRKNPRRLEYSWIFLTSFINIHYAASRFWLFRLFITSFKGVICLLMYLHTANCTGIFLYKGTDRYVRNVTRTMWNISGIYHTIHKTMQNYI
jgi:hypothetical protein